MASASALISAYSRCGLLPKAQQLHDELPIRNVLSWNALIAGYARSKSNGHQALHCFVQMQIEGISPDPITFTSVLKACGSRGDLEKGEEIHGQILGRGLLDADVLLGNSLVHMYARCGKLSKAEEVHRGLRRRDVVSWNALITGCIRHGRADEALHLHRRLQDEGLLPDEVTCICLLQACGSIGALDKGKQIHVSTGYVQNSIPLGNALVDMYSKCGMLSQAEKAIDDLSRRDTVSWSSLISGYVRQGQARAALRCFEKMQCEGHRLDSVTFICILKACASIGAVEMGERLHNEIDSRGLLKQSTVLATALLDMYIKFGLLSRARRVLLDDIPLRDVVAWNTLIVGYSQHRRAHEALDCFERMHSEGLTPDVVTFTCILKVCGSLGDLDIGQRCHGEIVEMGLLEKDAVLGNVLVDMYAKCGLLTKARQVLQGLAVRDVVSWTTLIAGYAQRGKATEASKCFDDMLEERIAPNETTFLCVLTACSHSGKLDEAQSYFSDMTDKYDVSPKVEHHTCMVGIYANAGYFEKAMSLFRTMPSLDHSFLVWTTILGACRRWSNINLGRLAFDQLVRLDCHCPLDLTDIHDGTSCIRSHAEKLEAARTWSFVPLVDPNGQYPSFLVRKYGTPTPSLEDWPLNYELTDSNVNIKADGSALIKNLVNSSAIRSSSIHPGKINQVTNNVLDCCDCCKACLSTLRKLNTMIPTFGSCSCFRRSGLCLQSKRHIGFNMIVCNSSNVVNYHFSCYSGVSFSKPLLIPSLPPTLPIVD